MPYATIADLVIRYDFRRLAQLVLDDDTEEEPVTLAGNTILETLLDDASSWIDMAVTQGDRYDLTDLAALAPPVDAPLVRLCCDLAYGFLVQRRGFPSAEINQLAPGFGLAQQTLERLRLGELVFPFDLHRRAGVEVDTYRPLDNELFPPISSEVRIFGLPRREL